MCTSRLNYHHVFLLKQSCPGGMYPNFRLTQKKPIYFWRCPDLKILRRGVILDFPSFPTNPIDHSAYTVSHVYLIIFDHGITRWHPAVKGQFINHLQNQLRHLLDAFLSFVGPGLWAPLQTPSNLQPAAPFAAVAAQAKESPWGHRGDTAVEVRSISRCLTKKIRPKSWGQI